MRLPIAVMMAVIGLSLPAASHHSLSMFDDTQLKQLEGTVVSFDWRNPHIWLYLKVHEGGQEHEWSFEGAGPGQLTPVGFSATVMKPGDRIALTYNPARDGSRGGHMRTITLPDGSRICNGSEKWCGKNNRRRPAP